MQTFYYKAAREDGVVATQIARDRPYSHAVIWPDGKSRWRANLRDARGCCQRKARAEGAQVCEAVPISCDEYIRLRKPQ